MMKKICNIRYLCAPFLKSSNQFAIGLAVFVFLLILPVVSCNAATQPPESEPLFSSYSKETYLKYCNAEHFNEKYGEPEKNCWSCDIVAILMDSMIKVVQTISPAAIELAKLILIYGSALWLAVFFLKTLTAATTQDPAQVLTSVFTFMFKIALVFILVVDGGFADLIDWIINPLLSIGIDIGTVFSYWASGGA